MIKASFLIRNDSAKFIIKGHADSVPEDAFDLICASVSSAAYMTANTITDILCVKADIKERDGYLELSFTGSEAAADTIRGLKLHLENIAADYPRYVKVTTEV